MAGCLFVLFVATAATFTPSVAQMPAVVPAAAPTPASSAYWPTNGWRTSTPEQQGMDSAALLAMLDEIQKDGKAVHGIAIVRNGYLVMEAYFHPYRADSPHYLASVTKSFTSALIGIAVQRRYIDGVNQKVLDVFSDRTVANVDGGKRAVTLEHLLTMSSGLDWPMIGLDERIWPQFYASPDMVQFVLDRPMADEPGSKFVYNSGGSHVLSGVIQKATGMSALDFASKNLFGPLGISNLRWAADKQGVNHGGWGLDMTPRDMAKFGYLYLNDGIWDGKTIVPAEWVKASGAARIDTGVDFPGPRYGYQWWVDSPNVYKASGSGGQRIYVVRDQAMVVAFVGGLEPADAVSLPEHYLYSHILPAVKSTTPRPANPEQEGLLAARLAALANPAPKPVPPAPAMASTVAGKLYTLQQASPLGVKGFSLSFRDDRAFLKAYFMIGTQEFEIGLDDVYRFTHVNVPSVAPTTVAMKGSWISSDTFFISMYLQDNPSDTQLFFKDNKVYMMTHDATGDTTISGVLNMTYPMPTAASVSPGQHPYSSFVPVEASDRTIQKVQVNYLLYLPADYGQDRQKKWPLILFLHGIGERGVDLEAIKKHPLPKTLEGQEDLPFIVVSPQRSLASESWSDMLAPLNSLLDQLQTTLSIDPRRIYLTGLSMGGAGAWEFGLRYPERFAAVAPVAGFYQYGSRVLPSNMCDMKEIPTWAFHGSLDTDVPAFQSEVLVEGLKACGGNVRLTLYPEADHEGAFYRAYGDPALFEWLLAQSRK